jgi:hypothetical protein
LAPIGFLCLFGFLGFLDIKGVRFSHSLDVKEAPRKSRKFGFFGFFGLLEF